jgi:hypothetical protein
MYMCWCATAAAAHARSVQRGTSLGPISPAISRILEQVQNIINKNALVKPRLLYIASFARRPASAQMCGVLRV